MHTSKKKEEILERTGYKNPARAQSEMSRNLRMSKIADAELREKIRQDYLYECPIASEQKVTANVVKRVEEFKQKARQAEIEQEEHPGTYKPDLSKTLKSRKVKERYHNGAWGYSEIAGTQAWSCCMCESESAPGCCIKVRDLDRWNTLTM